jgi:hypothetical protein
MRDYRKWKRGSLKVVNLQLDAANPRIPRGRGIHEQRDLIAELVEHDNVYDLAKAISTDGYFPLEYLIVIEDDGKTIVVEGNRRLAALKLLINPELAPEDNVKSFRSLSSKVALDMIEKVPVIYAPTREAAAPLIMQKHTRAQVDRWSTLQQASFYKTLAESGLSLSELAEEYGRPQSEIAGFLRTDTMYAIACSLEYPDDVAKIVRDPRQFSAAMLQRLLDMSKVREFLGIEFHDQVKLVGKVNTKEFKKAYARIITDIANEDIDSRKINTVEDAEKYLAKLAPVKPKKSTTEKFGAKDFEIDVPDLATGSGKTSTKMPPKKRRSQTMIPTGVRCELDDQRISDIFNELRRLKTDSFPNACAVLTRVLLELAVGEYLEATKEIKPLLDKAKRDGKPHGWYPTLKQMMGALLKLDAVKTSMRTLAWKKINRLVASKDSLLSLESMDAFVHNNFDNPSPRELASLASALEGLMVVILQPPPPPSKPTK